MKPSIARYTLLKYQPFPNRSEHLNYGLLVFPEAGGVRVHIAPVIRKLKVFDPNLDLESIRAQETDLPKLIDAACGTGAALTACLSFLNAMRVLRNVQEESLGTFAYRDENDYLRQVQLSLTSLCEAPRGPGREKDPKSRLFMDVKSRFKALGILAREKGVLPDHQVVEQYIPDKDADLKVEFALQNGLLRMAQTVDLRADSRDLFISTQHRQAAYSKAFALHYAKTTLENSGLRSYVIVAGANTDPAKKVLNAIEGDVDHVLEWESKSDMDGFFAEWAEAAGRPMPSLPMY
jgi:hypothetical protein